MRAGRVEADFPIAAVYGDLLLGSEAVLLILFSS